MKYSAYKFNKQGDVHITHPLKKKNKIMLFAAIWMDLAIVILSEVSQTEKDKYNMRLLICGL